MPNDLELVDVGEERHPLLGCLGAASHGDELQVRDQKRAEQIRRLLPYPAFGEVGDEDAAVLHRVGQVELRRVLAEDGAQRRRGGELPDFVEDRSRRFGAVALVVLRVLPSPEAQT